jgi:hypothetical protein
LRNGDCQPKRVLSSGRPVQGGPLRRAVQPMIEMLERNRVDKEEA